MKFHDSFYSLPASIQNLIRQLVLKVKPSHVVLFGSRARGDHREHSDFDIALKGIGVDIDTYNQSFIEIQEEPYTLHPVDIVEYEKMDENYRKNIDKEGQIIYG